jgi:hypothetical protein
MKSASIRKSIGSFLFFIGLILARPASAQTSDTIPSVGTFYLQSAGSVSVPYPYDPYYGNEPIEVLNASNRVYLIQDSTDDFAALQSMHSLARRSMAMEDLGGDSGDGSDSFSYVVPTNGLWLELTNVSGGLAHLNLHHATNSVYEIFSKTALTLTNWNIELALWPTNGAVMPFTVPVLDRTDNLFVWARDWTGVTSGGNTVPEWWLWENFGNPALSDTNLDGYGNTLLSDYQNGRNPNILQFSIEVTNDYVNNMSVPVQLNVFAGVPSYVAVSVDDTNYSADASWTAYTSSNLTVNLGFASGWHDVWIGLRGHADAPSAAAWQYVRLKLNSSPPALVITNPVMVAGGATTSVPLVQIKGYTAQNLASFTYDISNATGVVTGQDGGITDKYYDPTTWELTTNYFEAVDVPLAVGLNVITLHATDTAGNTTTTNINLTLDYSTRTNPPAVQLFWPKNGEQISGSNFTWRGWVDDPMATVSAKIIGADGTTNKVTGLVERNGNFWVENLPMPNGTNSLTLTVTDSAGNIATTNITVSTCPFTVTMTPIPDDQLWAKKVTATGTISDSTQSLWINGVKAGVTNGVWTANNVPMTEGGVASFDITCYPPGETQPDGSHGN